MALAGYLQQCIDLRESMNDSGLLHGLGKMIEDSIKPIGSFITLFLLAIRLFISKFILTEFSMVWIFEAIYQFFIGIYLSKWMNIITKIESLKINTICANETRTAN